MKERKDSVDKGEKRDRGLDSVDKGEKRKTKKRGKKEKRKK